MTTRAHHPPKASNAPPNPFELTPEQKEQAKQNDNYKALAEHTSLFAKKLFTIERVHTFVGWNLANITIVETDAQTLVVVDTGEDLLQMQQVWDEFQKDPTITDEAKKYPVEVIILTHHHADHVNGTQVLLKKFPDAVVWGADNLHAEFQQENGLIAPLMTCRAMAQYNWLLSQSFPEEVQGLNSGIGPLITQGPTGYIQPTKLISTRNPYQVEQFEIGKTKFQIVYVPSEANSEIAIYLPDRKVLLSAEVIQDHSFPNLYTLRGANFRDPSNWSKSIDCFLNNFGDAQHMILQHGPPIINNNANTNPSDPTTFPIKEVLTNYRDAIQYVRDQTLRYAMKGYAKEEIVHLVRLPIEQENYKPWLQPFYGNIKHCVPAVYTGYIGWFDGDPVALTPLPRTTFSARLIKELGGEDAVLQKAIKAYDEGNQLSTDVSKVELAKQEWQYASELATYLIRSKAYEEIQPVQQEQTTTQQPKKHTCSHQHADSNRAGDSVWWQARYLKAACFRQIAYRENCANWYGTYLTAAYELEGYDLLSILYEKAKLVSTLAAPVEQIPASIDSLAIRLKAELATNVPAAVSTIYLQAAQSSITILVRGEPKPIATGEVSIYKLLIRNGVLIGTEETSVPEGAVTVSGTSGVINTLLHGDLGDGFDTIINSDQVTIAPPEAKSTVSTFFSYFEAGRYRKTPNIYVH
eukprot:Phypoly_transcript_03580.p1 GENE.Phypoly_transcript_03580~~Phypoly_transcript_03580.p1  ORF type:complete len:693 (+),score=123.26 Phypoly_transcript_03580:113-2191(+)